MKFRFISSIVVFVLIVLAYIVINGNDGSTSAAPQSVDDGGIKLN